MTARLRTNHLVRLALLVLLGAANAGEQDIDLKAVRHIVIPAQPNRAESSMASLLQDKLRVLYGEEATVVKGEQQASGAAVLLGRSVALASGMVSEDELAAVKFDGFVMKGAGHRIALAGYQPQGTIYATHAFLRHVGLKSYPWRNFGAVEVREPVTDGILKPFSISSKPFFTRRDLLSWLDQGRWGASQREYSFGELRFALDHEYFKGRGWLGGDHTAPYLVPMGKYHDEHPEYFAMKGGKRIPKSTQNMRVTLCVSNPDVHRIAAERALEWMELQKQRRFFHISDGDSSECRCPDCVAMDPLPHANTDRYLKWVNSVASAVKQKFPDNVLMALAYIHTVKPPAEVKAESNVVIMYCPWYWNSRATSAVTWANPLNITAMKEFMAWAMAFPSQVALYDYPGGWVKGQADRLKFLAKNNARVFYACGGSGDLYQYVNTRLLWDPFLNTEDLINEFVTAYYGPAAEPMREYRQIRQDAIDRHFMHGRDLFKEPSLIHETRRLMRRAEELAAKADDRTQARILAVVLDGYSSILQRTHPRQGRPALGSDVETYQEEAEQYVALYKRLLGVYERVGGNYVTRQHKGGFQKAMARLGIELKPSMDMEEATDEPKDVFELAIESIERQMDELREAKEPVSKPQPKTISLRFDSPDEAGKWLSDGSQKDLISEPTMATVTSPLGDEQTGVKIAAPLSKLPVIPYHKLQIHAGRFYAEKVFDRPIDVTDCYFLDFHLRASTNVPVTIYVNSVHSDVDLHAGEQLVRIDFRNYQHRSFTYEAWDKKIRRIGFDIWPQDNHDPYPAVRDLEIVFFGMTATNTKPAPDRLPHRGKAIWLSQYRPNIGRGVAVPRNLYGKYMQRQHYKHVGMDYGSRWISERFRTFTEHRAVSPVFAILTAKDATPLVREAAQIMRDCLGRRFGVKLPINPKGVVAGPDTGNVIMLGRDPCVGAGLVQEEELKHVGPEGFVINAHNGRIAIAGPDDRGTAYGVARYLEDHGVRFFLPVSPTAPGSEDKLLHELYLLDWPHFRERRIHGGWELMTQSKGEPATDATDVVAARTLSGAIKDAARAGKKQVSDALIQDASRSALSRYVAAKLLWDPFADSTRLVREFQEAAGEQP